MQVELVMRAIEASAPPASKTVSSAPAPAIATSRALSKTQGKTSPLAALKVPSPTWIVVPGAASVSAFVTDLKGAPEEPSPVASEPFAATCRSAAEASTAAAGACQPRSANPESVAPEASVVRLARPASAAVRALWSRQGEAASRRKPKTNLGSAEMLPLSPLESPSATLQRVSVTVPLTSSPLPQRMLSEALTAPFCR